MERPLKEVKFCYFEENCYLVPTTEVEEFDSFVDQISNATMWGGHWYNLNREFEESFGRYLIEGKHPALFVDENFGL